MGTVWQDLRFAVRTMRREWLVTGVAVLSLALAIAGNATVFSMVDAFIFRPLPVQEPERLVLAGERLETQPAFRGSFGISLPTFADLAERSRTVDGWAAFRPRTLGLRGPDRSEAVAGIEVTADYFEILGVHPLRGRAFRSEETREGGPGVVLVSEDFRVDRYGEDGNPIGETLHVDGAPREVIGIVEASASVLTGRADLWLPLARSPRSEARDQRSYFAVGRLAPDATMEQARRELDGVVAQVAEEHPATNRGWTIDVYNLRNDVPIRQTRILFFLLQGTVLVVLLIACVNIANLLTARGQTRVGEIALRTVLGAGRGRILRQLLTETALLVSAGALLGIALGAFGVRAVTTQIASFLPPGFDVAMDGRVVAFSLGVAMAAGLAAGLAPALQTLRTSQAAALRGRGQGSSGGRSTRSLVRFLVVGEIALSFASLGGGMLLVRAFMEVRDVDPGFEHTRVVTGRLLLPASRFQDDGERLRFARELIARAGSVPGVEAAALSSGLPLSASAATDSFRIAAGSRDADAPAPNAVVTVVSPGYLETMDLTLLQGRFFEPGDRLGSAPVAVVSRSLADARFADADPLGARLLLREGSWEVVGVVDDVQHSVTTVGTGATQEAVYLPAGHRPAQATTLSVRAAGDPTRVEEPLRRAVEAFDRDLALTNLRTLPERLDQFFVGVDLFNVILAGFGVLALLLASLGTYGVLAYQVGERRHEIGIRMAVGAQRSQVVGLIARQGLWLGAVGLVLGGALTWPLVGTIRALLAGFATVEGSGLIYVGALLLAVIVAASVLPARRAAHVDPVRSMREE